MDCPIAAKYQPALACFSAPNQHRILQYLTHLAARQYTGLTLNAVVRVCPRSSVSCREAPSRPLCGSHPDDRPRHLRIYYGGAGVWPRPVDDQYESQSPRGLL